MPYEIDLRSMVLNYLCGFSAYMNLPLDRKNNLYDKMMKVFTEREGKNMTYEVDLKVNGVTSAIDTITAPEGYTAEDYISACERNADDDWNAMLADGEVILMEVK